MQTTGLPSSHPAPTRAAKNSVSEKPAQAAEGFSDVMHRALSDTSAGSHQQKILHSPLADETAREEKSASDDTSVDKKRARAKRNSERTSAAIPSQFFGIAGTPPAAPQPVAQNAGNAHDSDDAKGSTTPVSDDSTNSETADATSTDIETVDQPAEPVAAKVDSTAETQISTESSPHSPAVNSAALQELAAQTIEPNSDPANPAEATAPVEDDPSNTQIIGPKTTVAQAGAPPPDPRGTSAAKQDMSMKKAEKTPKVAGQIEQDLPGITATGSEEMPKGQKLSTKEAFHGEKLETAAVEMPLRVLTSSDSPAPTASVAAVAPSPTFDTRVLERTHDIVALHAMRVGEYTSDSLHVVVKPGAGIQLSLELRQSARGIEVRASLHKGDFEQLNQHWPDLQQRLEARGVRLGTLTTSENFTSGHQQFQQSKQQSPNQDPLYAGAFAEFALAGSMTEAPAARAARATAYRGWETWA